MYIHLTECYAKYEEMKRVSRSLKERRMVYQTRGMQQDAEKKQNKSGV